MLLNSPEPEASSADTFDSAEQVKSDENDILTKANAASPGDTTEISNAAQMQQLMPKRIADTEMRFERQGYDRDWSFEYRQLISDLFIVHAKELENFNVTEIECKRSACRIQSEISGEQFMQIMELASLLWYTSQGTRPRL